MDVTTVTNRAWPCCMTDHSKEVSSVISALSVNISMRNLRYVLQCIDGQSGGDGGSFPRMIRHVAWPRPNRDGPSI